MPGLRNSSGKPHPTGVANQQHRTRAVGRYGRIECIVDLKITVRLERHTSRVGVVQRERGRRFADQRGEHALVGVLTDAAAAPQQQTATSDFDAAVRINVGLQIAAAIWFALTSVPSRNVSTRGNGFDAFALKPPQAFELGVRQPFLKDRKSRRQAKSAANPYSS